MSGPGVKGAARAKLPSTGMRPGHPRSLPATRRKKRLSPKAVIRGSGRVKVRAAVGIAGDKGNTPRLEPGAVLANSESPQQRRRFRLFAFPTITPPTVRRNVLGTAGFAVPSIRGNRSYSWPLASRLARSWASISLVTTRLVIA